VHAPKRPSLAASFAPHTNALQWERPEHHREGHGEDGVEVGAGTDSAKQAENDDNMEFSNPLRHHGASLEENQSGRTHKSEKSIDGGGSDKSHHGEHRASLTDSFAPGTNALQWERPAGHHHQALPPGSEELDVGVEQGLTAHTGSVFNMTEGNPLRSRSAEGVASGAGARTETGAASPVRKISSSDADEGSNGTRPPEFVPFERPSMEGVTPTTMTAAAAGKGGSSKKVRVEGTPPLLVSARTKAELKREGSLFDLEAAAAGAASTADTRTFIFSGTQSDESDHEGMASISLKQRKEAYTVAARLASTSTKLASAPSGSRRESSVHVAVSQKTAFEMAEGGASSRSLNASFDAGRDTPPLSPARPRPSPLRGDRMMAARPDAAELAARGMQPHPEAAAAAAGDDNEDAAEEEGERTSDCPQQRVPFAWASKDSQDSLGTLSFDSSEGGNNK
jgi:hypothetical protein